MADSGPMVPLRLIAAAMVVALAAACTPGAQPPGRPPAAEPATAPSTGATPTGRVVAVGARPEGIAVDPRTHLVAVGVHDPAAIVLLDGVTGTQRHRVTLPGTVRHLQIQAPGAILVPVEPANELLRVSVPDGQVLSRTTTGQGPHDAAATATGSVFVANEFGHSVAVTRGSSVQHTFGGLAQPGGVAAFGETVGVIDVGESTLTVFDADRLTEIAKIDAGDGPTHVVADRRGRFVVVDTRGNALLLFATTPSVHLVLSVPLEGNPYGVTYDPTRDRLWVTLTARNELVGFDLATNPPAPIARHPTIQQPNSVAVDSATGRVFLTGTANDVLQYLDP